MAGLLPDLSPQPQPRELPLGGYLLVSNGEWRHVRWLNGDETHQGRHVRLEPGRFSTQRVRLYRYR